MSGAAPQRLVNKADFERLLSVRAALRSAHFAVHHVAGSPHVPVRKLATRDSEKLSTGPSEQAVRSVDELPHPNQEQDASSVFAACSQQLWLGCVVPKRLARRAVTRNLLKRQVRSAFQRCGDRLPGGLWLVRLRAPFPVNTFVSARSSALAGAARDELNALLKRASLPARTPVTTPALRPAQQGAV